MSGTVSHPTLDHSGLQLGGSSISLKSVSGIGRGISLKVRHQ